MWYVYLLVTGYKTNELTKLSIDPGLGIMGVRSLWIITPHDWPGLLFFKPDTLSLKSGLRAGLELPCVSVFVVPRRHCLSFPGLLGLSPYQPDEASSLNMARHSQARTALLPNPWLFILDAI